MSACRSRNVASSSSCCAADVDELSRLRMLGLGARPRFERIAAVHAARQALECLLRRLRARAWRWRAGDRAAPTMPSSSLSFCSNFSRPSRNEPRAFGADLGLEVVHVGRRPPGSPRSARRRARRAGAGRRRLRSARGRSSSMNVERAAHRLDADLDEDAGRLLDVVAGRLNQSRRLAQLRQHAAGAFGRRRVREQHLPGQARGQQVGVVLRMALPGPDLLELEDPAADVRRRACGARAARLASAPRA